MYARLPDLVFVVSMAARQEVIQDEIGDVATEPVPTRQVVAEMHARENAALRGFVRRRREARERALYPREHFRSHVPLNDGIGPLSRGDWCTSQLAVQPSARQRARVQESRYAHCSPLSGWRRWRSIETLEAALAADP